MRIRSHRLLCGGLVAVCLVAVSLLPPATEAAPVPKPPRPLHPTVVKLAKLVAPPAEPQRRPTVTDWAAAEKALGTPFPDDYKDLVATYGEGYFTDEEVVWLYTPKHSQPHFRVAENNLLYRKAAQEEWEQLGSRENPPIFPDEGGYLFVGTTAVGKDLSYRPSGKPNEWSVVLYWWRGAERKRVEECKVGLAELLLALAEGKSTCSLAALKGFDPPMKFVPHREEK